MIRSVLSSFAAIAVALTMGTAPVLADNSFEAHGALLDAITSTGTKVYINPAHCYADNAPNGFYVSQSGVFVVCQDNRVEGGEQVEWTANDLDTIRHEAQHLIQDCKDGLNDNSLVPFFSTDGDTVGESELGRYVMGSSLGRPTIANIIETYEARGADQHTVLLELEAFATAADIHASDITNAVNNTCPIK